MTKKQLQMGLGGRSLSYKKFIKTLPNGKYEVRKRSYYSQSSEAEYHYFGYKKRPQDQARKITIRIAGHGVPGAMAENTAKNTVKVFQRYGIGGKFDQKSESDWHVVQEDGMKRTKPKVEKTLNK